MCSNYRPVTRADRLLIFFGVELPDSPEADVYPLGKAPFIRLRPEGEIDTPGRPALVGDMAVFGLLPSFATELKYGRRTYNARSETVAKLASFRQAWAGGQRCIIPAEAIFEPSWESGKSVRWRISQPADVPMGIAGIYRTWRSPEGERIHSMTMLTVNADGHPVMQHFHRPEDEKRMVVILAPEDYLTWLTCSLTEAPSFFRQWMGPLDTAPAPQARAQKLWKPESGSTELF